MGANAFGLGPFGGLQGLNNMGLGNNFTEIQQRMQREVIQLIFFSFSYESIHNNCCTNS
jgi:hypothetical protein